jgi:hypothetical protein
MRTIFVCLIFSAFVFADEGHSVRWSFEDATAGKLPSDWSAAKTGTGAGSVWTVVQDKTAPKGPSILAQTSSEGASPLFNLCVLDEVKRADLDLAISFKAVDGKIDQGGGPVWRYKDANNYYIARMNPLENNIRVYKVVDGKRTQLGTADVEAAAQKWHAIRVVHAGNRIRCILNGKQYLDVKDETFKDAGKIGLWTKADAVTYFDDLEVKSPSE